MKVTSFTVLFCLSLLSAVSVSGWRLGAPTVANQHRLGTVNYHVPGESPLEYCDDPSDNLLLIEKVSLDPNPPQPGKPLIITGSGYLNTTLTEGAEVHIVAKYRMIILYQDTVGICEHADEIDKQCPLEPQRISFNKTVDIPDAILPGSYHIMANAYTADSETLTCLVADLVY